MAGTLYLLPTPSAIWAISPSGAADTLEAVDFIAG